MNDYEYYDETVYEENCEKAQSMLNNPGKVEKLLKRLEKKLQGLPVLNDTLAYIPQMGLMVNSYIKQQYTDVPIGIIAAILGTLLYFVAPVDMLPDFIPGIGYLDDAAMICTALWLVKSDLDEYMEWRENNGLDEITHGSYTII